MTSIIIACIAGIILGWSLSSILSKKRRKEQLKYIKDVKDVRELANDPLWPEISETDVRPSYGRHPNDFGGRRPIPKIKGGLIRRRLGRKVFK